MNVSDGNFLAMRVLRKLFCSAFSLMLFLRVQGQCDPFTSPGLFGLSQTSVYCKNQDIQIGVYNSVSTQTYYFSLYRYGAEAKRKGGPLTGNGGTLSVGATMRSAQDAGEYRISSFDTCGHASSTRYYAIYGAIDNLSILSWGGNNVSFNWAAAGPTPTSGDHITYDYIVTTRSNPDLVSTDSILSTTDTFAL